MTIAKSGKAIFGGFTSASWRSTNLTVRVFDDKASLFSIKSSSGEERWSFHKVLKPKYAIENKNGGPKFGRIPDLMIHGQAEKESVSVFGSDYECEFEENCQSYFTDSITFKVDDYEVYSVY